MGTLGLSQARLGPGGWQQEVGFEHTIGPVAVGPIGLCAIYDGGLRPSKTCKDYGYVPVGTVDYGCALKRAGCCVMFDFDTAHGIV